MTNPSYTDEQVPEVVRTAPERIFLQVSDEDYCKDDRFPDEHDEVTWCDDSVTDVEVEYVRADLFAASEADRQRPQAEVEALRSACIAMIDWDEAEQTHAVDFYKRMDMCRDAFEKARIALALSRATPNETKEAKL